MADIISQRYEIEKYQKLIKDYKYNGSTELGNLVLTGDELLDFVDAMGSIKDYHAEYKEIKEKYEKLIKNIENLFKEKKESSLVNKINKLLKEAKNNLEE